MRLPRVRFTVRRMMVVVALGGSLLGAERLWRRAEFYRKQAALCAYFEMQLRHHAASDTEEDQWEGLTAEEKAENVFGQSLLERAGLAKKPKN